MASCTPEAAPDGDVDHDNSPSPGEEQSSSLMESDAFGDADSQLDPYNSFLDDLEQQAHLANDEDTLVTPPDDDEVENVKLQAGDEASRTPFDDIDAEGIDQPIALTDLEFNFEMPDANQVDLNGQLPTDEESPVAGTLDFDTQSSSMQARPLNFGNSVLGRGFEKARELAAEFRRLAPSSVDDSQEPVSPRYDSVEATVAMPPPAPPRMTNDQMEAEFKKQQANHQRKSKADTLTVEEEIEFLKLSAQRDARLRKMEMDRRADQELSPAPESESALFVSEASDAHLVPYDLEASDDDDDFVFTSRTNTRFGGKRKVSYYDEDDDTTTTTTGPKQKSKSRRKSARNTGEDAEVDAVLAKAEALQKTKAKNGKATAAKGGGRGKKQKGPTITNVESLFSADVFRDTQKNAGLHGQPTFHGTTRRDRALNQLIASVPQENRRIAVADKRFLDEACKSFKGTGSVKVTPDGHWLVKGMRSSLKHYQVLGTAFMRKREDESHLPKGGILADEMGLGKTVMMLANIVNGRSSDEEQKCTLLVASPALCNQWEAEIRKHTLSKTADRNVPHAAKHGLGSVVQHRAGHRVSSDPEIVRERIVQADICLTTYQEICKSYPKPQIPAYLTTAAQKDAWWKQYFEEQRGVFHRIKFHRVVLDEAQAIKNHKGHTSLACRAVEASHYWAITGTPIMNRLTEFYPYFKFLRDPHTGSFRIFKENFCTPDDPDGTARLAVFLRKIMIRRTHLDTLFGARLLDLPQPKQAVVWLRFNDTERQIYEIVKARFIQRVNTISTSKDGVSQQSYNHIWSMLLRLRQLCSHILLIQGTIMDLLRREDFEKLNALCRKTMTEDEGASILLHLRHVLQKSVADDEDTVEAGAARVGTVVSASQTASANLVEHANVLGRTGHTHGLRFNFQKYMQHLVNSDLYGEIEARSSCCACREYPHQPHVTSCFHIYCLACLHDLQHQAARSGRDQATCVECGLEYTSVEPCALKPTYPDASAAATSSFSDVQSFTGSGKGGKGKGKKAKEDKNDWIAMKGEVLPSTKTVACKAQILEWLEEDPRCKIIVYTQFMPIIRILAKVCLSEKWNHVVYQGAMSHDARSAALRRFDENVECNIMLMSLRCGGLGLNLTMASRVILIDPWWNSAVEQQAFCRVFRIGQEKETRMTRFVIENSIDAAMMNMKEKKEREIDEVMENPRLKEKISVKELLRMFGKVGEDENGRPFIFADAAPDGEQDHERFREQDPDNEDHITNEH